ncbi:uncharacterized protein LAESUDRAFT_721294, partial [Laetiporus sulphureus 93-53]
MGDERTIDDAVQMGINFRLCGQSLKLHGLGSCRSITIRGSNILVSPLRHVECADTNTP